MTLSREYLLTCDAPDCDAIVEGDTIPIGISLDAPKRLRQRAKSLGWRLIPSQGDFCPEHNPNGGRSGH